MFRVFRRERQGLSYKASVLFAVVTLVFPGCGIDHSGQIVDLQKQIALLSRQIEEMRKEISLLRDNGAIMQQALNDAEAEINRLKTLETLPTDTTRSDLEEETLTLASVPGQGERRRTLQQKTIATTAVGKSVVPVTCAQVWFLLGKGKEVHEVATTLQTSVGQIQACEEKIGRGSER